MRIKVAKIPGGKHGERWLMETEARLVAVLEYVGESVMDVVRNIRTYTDRTGNLRNSLGYSILVDGREVRRVLSEGGPGGEKKGQTQAARTLQDQGGKHPGACALIVVAGMNYAAAVQARGYDVLGAGELHAEAMIRRMVKELGAV